MFDRIKSQNSAPAEENQQKLTLTVDELTKELHISRPTAYELVNTEGFPSFKIGNRILISRKGLEEWIERQCGSLK